MLTIISSQRYLNESIVLDKMNRSERWIHITPAFLHEGKLKAVLLDGHHSLEASKRLGEIPKVDIVSEEDECEIELIYFDEIDWFLDWNKNEAEYFEIYALNGDYHPVNE